MTQITCDGTRSSSLNCSAQDSAYRARGARQLVPGCRTLLANEQVLANGICERSGDIVERRNLEQWFFRITAYAEELLDALDGLDWPERARPCSETGSGGQKAPSSAWPSSPAGERDRGLHDPAGHELRHDLRGARS